MKTFDEELDTILKETLKSVAWMWEPKTRDYLPESCEKDLKVLKQALKEAIDKHIVGDDREYMKYEMCPHGCGPQYNCSCDSAEFSIKAKQRQALWGKEGEENGR